MALCYVLANTACFSMNLILAVLCKDFLRLFQVTWSTDCWTSFITTLHILWFSFLRFFSLQWPHQFKHFVKKHGKVGLFNCLFEIVLKVATKFITTA